MSDFGQKSAQNNKRTDLLIGSFALSPAVPTGIELAVRNFPVRLSMKFKIVFNVHTDIVVKIYSI
jgi:hypothetical protein